VKISKQTSYYAWDAHVQTAAQHGQMTIQNHFKHITKCTTK